MLNATPHRSLRAPHRRPRSVPSGIPHGGGAGRVAVGIVLLAMLGGCGEPPAEVESTVRLASASPLPIATRSEPLVDLDVEVERITLGSGGTLHDALARLDVPPALRPSILQALGTHVDARRLAAATGLSVVRDGSDRVVRVACRPDFGHYLRVELEPGRPPRAERIDVPVRRQVETAGGIVDHSVAAALAHHRDGATLTLRFADIFQWDVDLFVDPRPGDRVRLVYISKSLGRAEADLPPFGDAGMEEGSYLGIERVLAASYDGAMAASTAFWVETDGHGGNYYDADGQPLRKAFLKSPLNYRRISSRFTNRRRHPITRRVVPHHGVDFVARAGTPVVAAADGRILSAGWDGALGKAVRIRHGNGYKTIYGHLGGFARGIRTGARVEQNQIIGYVGSTGRATGSHLHYTLLHHDRPIDPMTFRNPPVEALPEEHRPDFERARSDWTAVLRTVRPEDEPVGIARAVGPS